MTSSSRMDAEEDIEYIAGDPITSPDLTTAFVINSPSHSPHPAYLTGDSSQNTFDDQVQSSISPSSQVMYNASETTSLLPSNSAGSRKKPFYRPRPLWIVPFAIAASIARGMTAAPRVEVFTQLSCEAKYGRPIDYNHTRSIDLSAKYYNNRSRRTTSNLDHTIQLSLEGDEAPQIQFLDIDDDDGEIDDPMHIPTKRCKSDPEVQAGAARLQTIMTTTMGVLSALTTGWWGHYGERRGRTKVLSMATLGLILTDLTFILVSTPHSIFASHGHKLIIVAPIIEGLLGGWSTLQAATSAYVSDCTSPGSRSHIFSRFAGVYYLGFAVGPMIGAFLMRYPPAFPFILASHSQSVAPVFWVAMMCSFVNFLLAVFVFPESLHKHKKHSSSLRQDDQQQQQQLLKVSSDNSTTNRSYIDGFIKPLLIFAPKVKQLPGRSPRRDYTLTCIGLAIFLYYLSAGLFQLKYLYAEHVFEWDAEQLSYYISFMGAFRALTLLFILPTVISAFKPKRSLAAGPSSSMQATQKPLPDRAQLASEISFDLSLSKYSLMVDLLSHTMVSLSPMSQTVAAQASFVGFTALSSVASGLVPSAQSLALCIIQSDQLASGENAQDAVGGTGSLFGAFSVMQAVGQMILGPLLFGLIYSSTVADFPKAIFTAAASFVFLALILVFAIRQPPLSNLKGKKKGAQSELEDERGRSKARKDLR